MFGNFAFKGFALLAGLGIILGAGYMLYLYRRIIFGQITKEDLKDFADLSPREIAIFAPLLVAPRAIALVRPDGSA